MKKRFCLVVAISIMFLLFLLFVFAATPDKWVECKSSCLTYNVCQNTGSGAPCCVVNDFLPVGGIDYYCCYEGGVYKWKDSACCTTIYRECKEYVDDDTYTAEEKFRLKHNDFFEDENTIHASAIFAQKVGNKYFACVPNDIDGGCCIDPNSCVYNGECYSNGETVDVDSDGVIEICVATSPGEWGDAGTIFGNVKDANDNGIGGARVQVIQGSSVMYEEFTNSIGDYDIDNVLYGTYDMVASADGYISSTATNIVLDQNQNLQNVDFTLVPGSTCEDDCTYAGDNIIHRDCDGINGCEFCAPALGCSFCDKQKVGDACNLAQPGWVRDYVDPANCPDGCVIECAENCPEAKRLVKAKVACEEENLIKLTKVVKYKGKLVKLVIVTCG